MDSDRLIGSLLRMPAKCDVVVAIGGIHVDVDGIEYSPERDHIVIRPHPDDLASALRDGR